jgi:hypothetical protein
MPDSVTSRWRLSIVGHGTEDPSQLLAHPENWRIHPHDQEAALVDALDDLGWIDEVIVNEVTGHVINGHLRVAAAISLGELAVPVRYVHLSEEQERKALATFDAITSMAGRDTAKLDQLIADVRDRVGPGLQALMSTMLETQRWPQLVASHNDATDGPGGGGASATARWTVMFARGAAPDVRAALGRLRSKLGPDVNVTWLED